MIRRVWRVWFLGTSDVSIQRDVFEIERDCSTFLKTDLRYYST